MATEGATQGIQPSTNPLEFIFSVVMGFRVVDNRLLIGPSGIDGVVFPSPEQAQQALTAVQGVLPRLQFHLESLDRENRLLKLTNADLMRLANPNPSPT